MKRLFAMWVVWIGLWPVGAHAQAVRASVVGAGGDENLSDVAWSEAISGAERAAREWGLELVPRVGVGPRLAGCASSQCLAREQEALDVEVLIVVSVFEKLDRSGVGSVAVALRRRDGLERGHSIEVEGRPIDLVAGLALTAVRAEYERAGVGPWLIVQGEPAGAVIMVDGADVGTLPRWEGTVRGGNHDVVVELEGYETFRSRTWVDANADEPMIVMVTLRSLEEVAEAHRDPWPSYVLGGGLLGIGIGLGVVGAVWIANAGNCVQLDQFGCVEARQGVDGGYALWFVGAGAFAVAGVVVMVVQPDALVIRPSVSPMGFGVSAEGRF